MENIRQQLKDLETAEDYLMPAYEVHINTSDTDAESFVYAYCQRQVDSEVCFVSCGGDGTLNTVISGLLRAHEENPQLKNKSFAVLAYGTGNDFVRYYPYHDFRTVRALFSATLEEIDVLKVTSDSQPSTSFFSLNVTNFGFDAVACSIANRLALWGVKHTYTLGALIALFRGTRNKIDVVVDGEKIDNKHLLLCTLSNCNFVGGGYRCAPRASNKDGLIDLCYIKPMSLASMAILLKAYRKGRHLDLPRCAKLIIYKQCRQAIISAKKTIDLCLDGEMLPGKNFTVNILEHALTFHVPVKA